jgi:transcription termination factor Rho
LLLSKEELEAANIIRKMTSGVRSEDATEQILDLFAKTKNNQEFIQKIKKYLH